LINAGVISRSYCDVDEALHITSDESQLPDYWVCFA
jgi:hypothetical protein